MRPRSIQPDRPAPPLVPLRSAAPAASRLNERRYDRVDEDGGEACTGPIHSDGDRVSRLQYVVLFEPVIGRRNDSWRAMSEVTVLARTPTMRHDAVRPRR